MKSLSLLVNYFVHLNNFWWGFEIACNEKCFLNEMYCSRKCREAKIFVYNLKTYKVLNTHEKHEQNISETMTKA